MSNCFILLAAGKGKRFKSNNPKQFTNYINKPLFMHSVDKAIQSKLFKSIIIVSNIPIKNIKDKSIKVIKGGRERYQSSQKALNFLKNKKIKNVFIHDAARPNFSIKLLKKLNDNLRNNKAVIPFIKTENSTKYKKGNGLQNLDRDKLIFTQTPQGYRLNDIYKLAKKNKEKVQDESSLFINNNLKVKFINGEIGNSKITYKDDLKNIYTYYGIGFDVHRLVKGRKFYLGGLKIKSSIGTLGHSDGDPVLHAITDAILGACKKGDIGNKFSDKNFKYKNIRSTILLSRVIKEIKEDNFFINNLDINIITQKPKISNYKREIIKSISRICEIEENKINIKGKTTEKLGVIGKEKAIACEVIASVSKYDL